MKALKSALASFIATIVLSASGIALAADDGAVETTDNSGVVVDIAGNIGDAVEGNSDVSDDSQLDTSGNTTSTDSTSDDSDSVDDYTQAVTTGECVTRDTDTFSRVVCPDTAKSATKDDVEDAPAAPKPAAATPNTQAQSSPVTPAPSTQSLSLPVADDVVNVPSDNPDVEKPKLPRTCGVTKATATSAKPVAKKCGQNSVNVSAANVDTVANVAGTVLVTDNALITASSRASLFSLVACAAFVVVGAGSVVSVRRLQH